jgi:hypothetical protein
LNPLNESEELPAKEALCRAQICIIFMHKLVDDQKICRKSVKRSRSPHFSFETDRVSLGKKQAGAFQGAARLPASQ